MTSDRNAMPERLRERIETREELFLDRFQGCLVGGAAGDALGYAVEFLDWDEIRAMYGQSGIRSYELDPRSGLALVSDDTQMTLFTAAAVLIGTTRQHLRGISSNPAGYAAYTYRDWLYTQDRTFTEARGETWLSEVPELYAVRAPGNTCMNAVRRGCSGTMEHPVNWSKGCGGVMRVAPVGLFYNEPEHMAMWAAECAALTHGHPLGYIPAAGLAYIVCRCAYGIRSGEPSPGRAIERIARECAAALPRLFPDHPNASAYAADLLARACNLACGDGDDLDCIAQLGQGWVGEEALAIAVFSAVRHAGDFGSAIRSAANHSGDSDSTAAICGNVVGAARGLSAIGSEWTRDLELFGVIMEIAKDLCDDCPMEERGEYWDEDWIRKYAESDKLRNGSGR